MGGGMPELVWLGKRHSWKRGGGLLAAFFLVLPVHHGFAQHSIWSIPRMRLNTLSLNASHVKAAVSPDGTRVVVAWDGYIGPERHVILRENILGDWLAELVVDRDCVGENHSPVPAFDSLGNLSIGWISKRPSGDVICVAQRIGEQWLQPIELPGPHREEESRAHYDALNLAIDAGFPPTVWLAWQATWNTHSTIMAAKIAPQCPQQTVWDVTSTLSEAYYNLSPQLFLVHGTPHICWVTTRDSTFITVAARFDPATSTWQLPAYHPIFDLIPEESFSQIVAPEPTGDKLAAVWVETNSTPETLVIKLAGYDKENSEQQTSQTFAIPLDGTRPTATALSHSRQQNALCLSFTDVNASQTLALRSALLRLDDFPTTLSMTHFPLGTVFPVQSLATALLGEGRLAVFYSASPEYGGDGHVYFFVVSSPR